jgi:hypothetical protein
VLFDEYGCEPSQTGDWLVPRVTISIPDKLASGAPLRFKDEFCPWLGISPVYGYLLIKESKLKVTRIGKTNYVTPENARACVALLTTEDNPAPAAKSAPAVVDDRRKRGRPEAAERRVAGPAALASADQVDE